MLASNLNERQNQFFKAVHDLMRNQYPDMVDQFGLWRIHQHFDLKEDETFHETSDLEKKESTLRIVKKVDLPINSFATTWKLTTSGPVVATWCCDDKPMP